MHEQDVNVISLQSFETHLHRLTEAILVLWLKRRRPAAKFGGHYVRLFHPFKSFAECLFAVG
jgi:hypothetical protein